MFLVAVFTAFLIIPVPANAFYAHRGAAALEGLTTRQILLSGTGGFSSGADRFVPFGYTAGSALTVDPVSSAMPVDGSITGVSVHTEFSVSGTQVYTIELMDNDTATGYNCSISVSSPSNCTIATSYAVTVGHYYTWRIRPTAALNTGGGSISVIFTPSTPNDTILLATGNGMSATTTTAVVPFSNFGPGTLPNRRTNTFAESGTIDRLVVASNAPGTGATYTFSMYRQGSIATGASCVISGTATTCPVDTTHSFTVTGASAGVVGEDVQFSNTPSTGTVPPAATAAFGARYVSLTSGAFLFMQSALSNDFTTGTSYFPLSGSNSPNGTESNSRGVSHAQKLYKITAKVSAAPGILGSGAQRTFTLRRNGADAVNASSAKLQCTIFETQTTCVTTLAVGSEIIVADGDLLDTSDVTLNVPVAAIPAISYSAIR